MTKFERHAHSQRKHGPCSVSGASKAPAPLPSSRPGWTGPAIVKKAARKPRPSLGPQASIPTIQEHRLPIELQQLILDIFRDTFPVSSDFPALKPLLQQINEALLQGDFKTALGTEECMEGYALRWSPSRALGYSNLLADICELRKDDVWVKRLVGDGEEPPAKVLCFGGGAAEIMSFAALLRHVRSSAAGRPSAASEFQNEDAPESLRTLPETTRCTAAVDLHLVDAADWSSVTSKLHAGLETPPELSKYASASARALNASLLSPRAVALRFTRANVLDLSLKDLRSMIGIDSALITLFFTLNDLYTVSIPKATAFLLKLTCVVPKGGLLLVVDNSGAVSTAGSAKDGEEKKEYPMSWLLNRTLLPTAEGKEDDEEEPAPTWEKLVDDAIRLYRHPDKGLRYPLGLENLRLQVHLFKRL